MNVLSVTDVKERSTWRTYDKSTMIDVFNRPGVAGAILQPPLWLIHSFIESLSYLSSKSSRHHKSQTVRAKNLTFWEYVHPPPCVTCQMSGTRCQVSGVTCHVSDITFFFFRQIGRACWCMVCYQRGLPRLVYKQQWFKCNY